jgi:hypothetical protein
VGVQTFVAMLLQVQNRTDEARARYQEVLEIDPRAAVAANNLAWIRDQGNSSISRRNRTDCNSAAAG